MAEGVLDDIIGSYKGSVPVICSDVESTVMEEFRFPSDDFEKFRAAVKFLKDSNQDS